MSNITDHAPLGGQVAFTAHPNVVDALDAAAARLGVTRSHFVRARIVEYLKAEGYMPADAPSSKYEARHRPSHSNQD